jgi:hypothetical protein
LCEHAGVIESAAHVVKFVNLGNAVLLVTILGSDEQCSASNQLVVLLVHNSLRAVSIEEVNREEESLGKEAEGGMGLDEEVDQVRSHEPLDLALHIDEGSIW